MTAHPAIAIVCNPKAGKGKALAVCRLLEKKLLQKNISFTLYTENWPQQFTGFTDVYIVGGDGTLNYFINKYPNIHIPLSVFKGGSGNDFAWKLYGDGSLDEQLESALHATPKKVDAGICNNLYFLNGVGVGFDGEVVKAMGKKRFISAGHLAYLWTVLKKIALYREIEIRLQYEGMDLQEKFFMISIANSSRYGGGFMVAPQASVTDGKLDMVLIRCIHRLRRIFYLPKVEKGKHLNLPFVETGTGNKFSIQSSKPVAGHVDGELIESSVFDIEILPGKYLFRF